MRLSKIKLSGFKSFVDPTTIEMRSNLTAIVGPNGCGKSNTIDAVRWVMGESSAKNLRGASMEDVIFNGSSSRKKVGQASIELVFDNSDGTLGGEYSQFSEIAIKRLLSRDGQSKYFLNGARCRRRDITDIFLGTGLGPRSYAIIEQGMISRLIEAKPEELRVYIEEAAGISKYKERRKETETRIRGTRDNLDRLNDLREEIDKQLGTLKRQASAAERFKDFKQTERRLAAELLYLQLQAVQTELQAQQEQINAEAEKHQDHLKQQRSIETQLEAHRSRQTEANAEFNQVQAGVYESGAQVSQLEQQIRHQHEIVQRDKQQREQLEQELLNARMHLQHDEERLLQAQTELELLEPKAEEMLAMQETQQEALDIAEQALNEWKQQWTLGQQQLAEPTRQSSVESSRIQQLQQQISRNQQRLQRLEQQHAEQGDQSDQAEKIELVREHQLQLAAKLEETEATLSTTQATLQKQQEEQREEQQQLNELRGSLQSARGRLSSLETLQQAGLGKDKTTLNQWLTEHHLDQLPRLAEEIKVNAGWETAVESLLGPTLEALQLPADQQLEHLISTAPAHAIELLLAGNANSDNQTYSKDSLAQQVLSPTQLKPLLALVYCAIDHQDALSRQSSLKAGERLITADGSCYGPNWVRLPGSEREQEGVIARQKSIDELQASIAKDEKQLKHTEMALEALQELVEQSQSQLKLQQQQQQQLHREESEVNARARGLEQQQVQQAQFAARLTEETNELNQQQEADTAQLLESEESLALAQASIEQLTENLELLREQQHPLEQALSDARQQFQLNRDQYQALQIQIETQRSGCQNSQSQIERVHYQIESLQARKLSHTDTQLDDALIASLQEQLEQALEQRKVSEVALTDARKTLSDIDQQIRDHEQARAQAEAIVQAQREKIEKLRLHWQTVNVREETLLEQLAETEFDPQMLQHEMDLSAQISSHQEQLQDIRQKIQRLGAINLAAIEEYESQNERKTYLDEQHADLTEAMETLESAIRKIDRDTRGRFKETFEKVNVRIQEMFPRLFGGGEAHLEMTGDDLLTTGISIMARPPGKRLSSIQLMSGGEKALTAVAMVFAIFELNPAPFCMLDEVDAPLDEANVGRFCELVRHMSKRVQFIFITHNKSTMEMAENLVGVTMREPGVSRMVAVDVNEAARMIDE